MCASPQPSHRRETVCAADFLPALALLTVGLVGLAVAWLASAPPSGQYFVIAPVGATRGEAITLVRSARGRLVATGYFRNTVIAASPGPGFTSALRKAGASLVLRVPPWLECAPPSAAGPTP